MSYKTPSYVKIDNDQAVNFISPNVIVIIAVGVVIAMAKGCSSK